MKRRFGIAVFAGLLLVGSASVALAQTSMTTQAQQEAKSVVGFLGALVFGLAFIVVAAVAIHGLVDAKHGKGWGHFVTALVCGLVLLGFLWAITSWSGQDPKVFTDRIKVDK